ncbi:MAG TPA: peptidase dimerization domain protein, partial [Catalimonadaceae bacterium]|nr:peptidase dimerization domain protein [Catalimonadaceae bacterium]
MTPTQYIQQNRQRFMDELFELLRIPSISADSAFKADVRRAAEYIKTKLEQAGADKVELCETAGFPIVYGEKMVDPSLPTVLVYGHYDVQPSAPDHLWISPAF